jgi:hypothetical protein
MPLAISAAQGQQGFGKAAVLHGHHAAGRAAGFKGRAAGIQQAGAQV